VAAYLDVDRSIAATGLVEERGLRAAWREWGREDGADPADHATIYKLYLSPTPAATPAALARVLPVLPGLPALLGLKLPRQRPALLRPDKVLLYFSTLDALRASAAQLLPLLDGIAAQGVPFTAALDDAGLLSWGADPPEAQAGEDTSWRVWLCERLGSALAECADNGAFPPWQPALDRLTEAGVDVTTWSPIPSLWAPARNDAPPAREVSDGAH
jgi:hypothetical protein